MFKPSPFLISESNLDSGSSTFNTITKKAYAFSVDWNCLVGMASEDAEIEAQLFRDRLLTTARTYMEAVKELLDHRKKRASRTLNITYTVTTRCDIGCPYCFQEHYPRSHTTPGAILHFHDKLKATLNKHPEIASVYLLVMGGEPMLCPDLVKKLLSETTTICNRAGVRLTTVMTVNGVHAPRQELEELKKSGLQELQVTFDGNREIHNQSRPTTYEKVMNNLPLLTGMFSTAIKYNVRKQSCIDLVFTEFLQDLERLNLDPQSYLIEFEPLQKSLGHQEDEELFFPTGDPGLATIILNFTRRCLEKDIPASLGPCLRSPCVGTNDNSLMIQPDGNISSCVTAYGYEPFIIGSIDEIELLTCSKEKAREAVIAGVRNLCAKKECPFFPICETGCLLSRLIDGQSLDIPLCKKNYYKAFFPGLTHLMLEHIGGRIQWHDRTYHARQL